MIGEKDREIRTLADENHRLKNTVVNKDSDVIKYEEFYRLVKERREAETKLLDEMLQKERERAIDAVKEQEQASTKSDMYERQAEVFERQTQQKENQIVQLTKEIDDLRK